jgi:predicted enzyme related to lactoylglutathione lyase
MTTQTQAKPRDAKKNETPASVVWFEIPADNVERAKKFYGALFGWKIEKFPGAAVDDYWHIDTGGAESSPDGALMKRMYPQQPVTNYVLVPSVDEAAAKVEKLGGKITKPKTEVPNMGRFVICRDTENNEFALWETDMDSQ